MNILLVSATPFEVAPLLEHLNEQFIEYEPFHFQQGEKKVAILITGVGMPLTAYSLGKVLSQNKYDLAIHAGIAGAFDREMEIGTVVEITSDFFADLGVEEADGSFTSVFAMGLIDGNQAPFSDGKLSNPNPGNFLSPVQGLSINKVHGNAQSIKHLRSRYTADVETMESAAFFYACLLESQKFLSIRAISNHVEPRNRDHWNIPLAIKNLNQTMVEMIQSF